MDIQFSWFTSEWNMSDTVKKNSHALQTPKMPLNSIGCDNNTMKEPTYTPISCSWYDRLEALATLKKPCEVIYLDAEQNTRQNYVGQILDIYARNKEEFLVLGKDEPVVTIRLDYLIAINGSPNPSFAFADKEE